MIAVIVFIVVALAVAHLAGGATRHVQHRRRGLRPRLSYTYGYGWWGSVGLPGNFRLGHRL